LQIFIFISIIFVYILDKTQSLKRKDIGEDDELKAEVNKFVGDQAEKNANFVPPPPKKAKENKYPSSLSSKLNLFEENKIKSLYPERDLENLEPSVNNLERRNPVGKTTITQQIKSIQSPIKDLAAMNRKWR
jgi:hypothetical protein